MIKEDDKHQFVAMDHCPICGEVVSLVVQTSFTEEGQPLHEMPKDVCTSLTPCEKCKKKAKDFGGVWCYEGRHGRNHPEPTGRIVMLTRDCVQRIFDKAALEIADDFGYLIFEPELFSRFIKHSETESAGK